MPKELWYGEPRDKRYGKGWDMPPFPQFSLTQSAPRPYRSPCPCIRGKQWMLHTLARPLVLFLLVFLKSNLLGINKISG